MITVTDRIDLGNYEYINLDARYTDPNGNPFSSVSAAQTYHAGKMNELFIGLTVLVKESGWTEAKEYWVQPKGTTPETYGLVEKGAGTTDYADLDNKPTINNVTLSDNKTASDLGLATAAQGALAGTAVQQITRGGSTLQKTNGIVDIPAEIQEAVASEVAAGGTPTATLVNGTLTLGIPRGADGNNGHNPCLGVFADQTALETAHPTAEVGDYAYADVTDSTTQTTTSHIFRYSGSAWVDNGEGSPDSQTAFDGGAGPTVAGTKIDDTRLANPADNALAKATDVMPLAAKLEGVTAEEEKQTDYTILAGNVKPNGSLHTNGNHVVIALPSGTNRVRFLAQTVASLSDINLSYAFWNAESYVDESTVVKAVAYKQRTGSSNVTYEVIEKIPVGATHIAISLGSANTSTFYCYLRTGDSVKDLIDIQDGQIISGMQKGTIVPNCFVRYDYAIDNSTGNWGTNAKQKHGIMAVSDIRYVNVKAVNSTAIAFLTSHNTPVSGTTANAIQCWDGTDYRKFINANTETGWIKVPENATYLYFGYGDDFVHYPSAIEYAYNNNTLSATLEGEKYANQTLKLIYPVASSKGKFIASSSTSAFGYRAVTDGCYLYNIEQYRGKTIVITANADYNSYVTFLTSNAVANGEIIIADQTTVGNLVGSSYLSAIHTNMPAFEFLNNGTRSIMIPNDASYVVFTKNSYSDANNHLPTVVKIMEVVENSNGVCKQYVSEVLEMVAGTLSENTGNIRGALTSGAGIFRKYIYPLFLDLDKIDKDSLVLQSVTGATITFYCFDHDFGYIGYSNEIIEGTRYVRWQYEFAQEQTFSILQVTVSFAVSGKNYWLKDGLKQGEVPGDRVQWFPIEVDTPSANGDYATTDDYLSGQAQRDFTNGCLRYAVDYSNTGKPTPLIILFHGTSGYAFNKSSFTNEEEARYSFLAKCGYNVVDVSSVTYRLWYASDPSNVNNRNQGANFCYPVSEKNYIAIFEYVCKYFNIDRSRVYGLAKSAGGMLSTLFSTRLNSEIPLRATAQIAPGICTTINMLEITAVLNNFYLAQIGCQNPQVTGGLSGGYYDGRPAIQTDKDYILANLDKICRYDPFLTNTIGLNYTEFITRVLDTGNDNAELTGNTDIANLISSAVKIYSCPVKIWHSRDDDRVPYIQSKWVVDMGSRAGQEIFLRTFPDEHGGHFIDGFLPSENNPNPTLTDYTNKFGVTLSDVSVVYSEVVDWFNRF